MMEAFAIQQTHTNYSQLTKLDEIQLGEFYSADCTSNRNFASPLLSPNIFYISSMDLNSPHFIIYILA